MFVPRHPETASSIEQLERAESTLDISRLVKSAVMAATHEVVTSTAPHRDAEVTKTSP
jgi:hypothetical protein